MTSLEIVGEDSVSSTLHSMAYVSSAQSRIPRQIEVGHTRRARQTQSSRPAHSRSSDGIPGTQGKSRAVTSKVFWLTVILASVGAVALVAAILIVTLGR